MKLNPFKCLSLPVAVQVRAVPELVSCSCCESVFKRQVSVAGVTDVV